MFVRPAGWDRYASKAETTDLSTLLTMYGSAADGGGPDASTVGTNRYDLLFSLVVDQPPPEGRNEAKWPRRDVSVDLSFEAGGVASLGGGDGGGGLRGSVGGTGLRGSLSRALGRGKAGGGGGGVVGEDEDKGDPVLTGRAASLDGNGSWTPAAFEPVRWVCSVGSGPLV